jgi:hypothetical protein
METNQSKATVVNPTDPDRQRSQTALRRVQLLVGGYLTISGLTLVAIVALRHHHDAVNPAVWVRGVIVVASAALMTSFAARTARGHARSYLRLRLVSAIMVVAIAVIISLPGTFPLWMKLDQGVCGVVLLGVVALVNGRAVRARFSR